jgi:hypothetical protein
VVAAVLLAASRVARGASVALAGLTKFAPLALAPLLATYPGEAPPGRPAPRTLRVVPFAAAFAGAGALAMLPVIVHGDFSTFWNHTIVFQNDRGSPFSVWGFYGGLGGPQAAVKAGAVALALLVALVPRERDVVQLAALAAAVVIALQLGVTHWFYLYIVWFLPLVLVALFGSYREPEPA